MLKTLNSACRNRSEAELDEVKTSIAALCSPSKQSITHKLFIFIVFVSSLRSVSNSKLLFLSDGMPCPCHFLIKHSKKLRAFFQTLNNKIEYRVFGIFTAILLSVVFSGSLFSQTGRSKIQLLSQDSILITTELFMRSDSLPFLILLHEQGSSRGEFFDFVPRFHKMNFNCLVPDLRNGGNSNIITNETASRAKDLNKIISPEAVLADINTVVNFAYEKSNKKVVIMGAGANGSLALISAKNPKKISAVVAMSPGEFFKPDIEVENELENIQIPVLITCTKAERPYIEQMVSNIDGEVKSIYTSETDSSQNGTRALKTDSDMSLEYWLTILMFFKDI